MTSPRATTRFRLAAAALGGASRAEPSFPAEVRDCPIAVSVSAQPVDADAPGQDPESRAQAAAAVREAFSKEQSAFRVVSTPDEADVVVTVTRAYSQPSLDFWDRKHAHASLVVRRTGQVLDAGSDYVEGRNWRSVGSTIVFLAKLQCAEHYPAIVRSRTSPEVAGASPEPVAPAREPEVKPLDVEPSMLSDEHLQGVLEELRGRVGEGRDDR
jgi:hypothetical protein